MSHCTSLLRSRLRPAGRAVTLAKEYWLTRESHEWNPPPCCERDPPPLCTLCPAFFSNGTPPRPRMDGHTVFFVAAAFCIGLHVSRCKVSTRCRIYGTPYLPARLSYQSAHTPLLDIATLSTSPFLSLTFRFYPCFPLSLRDTRHSARCAFPSRAVTDINTPWHLATFTIEHPP